MGDTFSKEVRSDIMRRVKSSRTKSTELRLVTLFKKLRLTGWRRNFNLYGKPDFVFPRHRIAVFADGCFWHGHTCRNLSPSQNRDYWSEKIKKNKRRDRNVNKVLKDKNWRVIRIWECAIKNEKLSVLIAAYRRASAYRSP